MEIQLKNRRKRKSYLQSTDRTKRHKLSQLKEDAQVLNKSFYKRGNYILLLIEF